MTSVDFSQVIWAIEARACRVAINDRFGAVLNPDEILAVIGHMKPTESDALHKGLYNKEITIEQYRDGWISLIEEFEKEAFVRRLDAQFKNLSTG